MSAIQDARKCYRNPFFTEQEFREDFRRLRAFQKCFEKQSSEGTFQSRMAYNHFIISCNCFGLSFVRQYVGDDPLILSFMSVLSGKTPSTDFEKTVFQELKEFL